MTVGFVGLGNMGSALAANLVATGYDIVGFDLAGPGGLPDGARFAASIGELAVTCECVVLSLPDGAASEQVGREIAAATDRIVTQVIDTSTIGPDAAVTVAAILDEAGITYVDAPVSGGVTGARARTLTVMYAAAPAAGAAAAPILAGLSDAVRPVGDRPGMAQALKLANNFLAATTLAATSEAVAFGRSVGLDPATMIEVLNASSGRSGATDDKFPKQVLTGAYASGFANTLMAKDVRLYLDAVAARQGPASIGRVAEEVWRTFAEAEPRADFTRIYPYTDPGAAT